MGTLLSAPATRTPRALGPVLQLREITPDCLTVMWPPGGGSVRWSTTHEGTLAPGSHDPSQHANLQVLVKVRVRTPAC